MMTAEQRNAYNDGRELAWGEESFRARRAELSLELQKWFDVGEQEGAEDRLAYDSDAAFEGTEF
jgi:hypothetical protein